MIPARAPPASRIVKPIRQNCLSSLSVLPGVRPGLPLSGLLLWGLPLSDLLLSGLLLSGLLPLHGP
jgi:hypothetical protein